MWTYNQQPFTEDMIDDNVGFVYLITNTTNGKQYIGKKLFTKSKRFQKNNKKRSKRVSSDWIPYTGSNKQLNQDIADGHVVEKQILYLCRTKGWMSYLETKQILICDCLLLDIYYNQWVSLRVTRTHLKSGQ